MDIYIMGVVKCPMNKVEQDVDSCLLCPHHSGQDVNTGESSHPRFYVACGYSGKGIKFYETSKSKMQATIVDGEPLPPVTVEGESWRYTGT